MSDDAAHPRDMLRALWGLAKAGAVIAKAGARTWVASKNPLRPTPPKTWEEIEREIYTQPFTGNYADTHTLDIVGDVPWIPHRPLMPDD